MESLRIYAQRGRSDSGSSDLKMKPRFVRLRGWRSPRAAQYFGQRFVALCFGVTALSAFAAVLKIEMPIETDVFKTGSGSEIANAQCLICHSVEYVSTQPPLPRAFWKASIEKMQTKYGAPVPNEQVDALVGYLVKTYGVEAAAKTNSAVSAPDTIFKPRLIPTSSDGAQLATANGCFGCHNVEKKIVGPPFQQVAAKYKGDLAGSAKVMRQITEGGSGQWGTIPMPPVKHLSAEEVRILSDWILAQQP